MASKRIVLFPAKSYLAVVGETEDDGDGDSSSEFWLCQTCNNVYEDSDVFNVHWLEQVESKKKKLAYSRYNLIALSLNA